MSFELKWRGVASMVLFLSVWGHPASANGFQDGQDYRDLLVSGADGLALSQILQCRVAGRKEFYSCRRPGGKSACRVVGVNGAKANRKVQYELKTKNGFVYRDCAEITAEKPTSQNRGCQITIRSCPFLEQFVDVKGVGRKVQVFQNGFGEEPELATQAGQTGLSFARRSNAMARGRQFPDNARSVAASSDLPAVVKRKKRGVRPRDDLIFMDQAKCRKEVIDGEGEATWGGSNYEASQCCAVNATGEEGVETRVEYWREFCTLQTRTYTFSGPARNATYRSGEGAGAVLRAPPQTIVRGKGKGRRQIPAISGIAY